MGELAPLEESGLFSFSAGGKRLRVGAVIYFLEVVVAGWSCFGELAQSRLGMCSLVSYDSLEVRR